MSTPTQTTPIEFQSFGKIPRMFRDIVITEKIDGTNAAVGITPMTNFSESPDATPISPGDGQIYAVYAQSRKRLINPMKDNAGFAKWVWANATTLFHDLGPGLHFGEWWGGGIQRGYGLAKDDKRFSLFNTKRWGNQSEVPFKTPKLGVVPVLYEGDFDTTMVKTILALLAIKGSAAVEGYLRPEGIVIYHTHGNLLFKATVENDEKPKTLVKEAPVEITGSGGIILPGLSSNG